MKYKVTMQERQADGSVRTLEQISFAPSREAVIEWYGINEPDIVSYTIKEEQ